MARLPPNPRSKTSCRLPPADCAGHQGDIPHPQDQRGARAYTANVYETLYTTLGAQYTPYVYDESKADQLPGEGCNLNQGGATPTFFPFPYDWRKDIATDIAPRLANYIVTCVRQFHPNAKIKHRRP